MVPFLLRLLDAFSASINFYLYGQYKYNLITSSFPTELKGSGHVYYIYIPSSKRTWQQKVDLLKMYLLLKIGISIAMLVHQRVYYIQVYIYRGFSPSRSLFPLVQSPVSPLKLAFNLPIFFVLPPHLAFKTCASWPNSDRFEPKNGPNKKKQPISKENTPGKPVAVNFHQLYL